MMMKDLKSMLATALAPLESLAGKLAARPPAGWVSIRLEAAERTAIERAVETLNQLVLEAAHAIEQESEPGMLTAGQVAALEEIEHVKNLATEVPAATPAPEPVPMLLWCPKCGERHLDVGVYATKSHHTHACQHCGMCWRPAVVPTTGVQFLPGFKD